MLPHPLPRPERQGQGARPRQREGAPVADGGEPRAEVVLAFSESPEHAALTAAAIGSETPAEFGILFA